MVITMILNLPELLKNQPKHKINLYFKPGKTSLRTELWYRNELLALVRKFRQAVESEDFFANEVNLNDGKFNDDASKDFDADRFLKAAEKLSKADIDSVAKKIAQGLLIRGNAQNIQEVEKDLKRQTRVDLQGYLNNSGKVAEKLEQLTTANVQLIKSIHSQYLDKIQAAVMQAQVKGTLTKDLAKQIQEIGGVTEKRAKLIARDQSAKINASLTRARHEEMGIKQYIWSTSGDERVRDSHAENDGKIFSYDDPPATGNPGDQINCRCVAIPYFGDKVEQGPTLEIEREQDDSSAKAGKMTLSDLIEGSIGRGGNKLYSDIGVIHPDVAAKAKESIGLDISGWRHSVDESGIRHTFKQHGNETTESKRGQRAVTKEDILLLPIIISSFDSIEYAGLSDMGNETFLIKKEIGDEIFTVQEVRKKHRKLTMKTMWIRRKSKKKQP